MVNCGVSVPGCCLLSCARPMRTGAGDRMKMSEFPAAIPCAAFIRLLLVFFPPLLPPMLTPFFGLPWVHKPHFP